MLTFSRILTFLIIFTTLAQGEVSAWWSDQFSQEDGGWSEFRGFAITGMNCQGKKCDDRKLYFNQELVLAGGKYEISSKLSNEDPRFECPYGTVMAGMRCYGKYCDDLYYYCQKPGNFRLKHQNNQFYLFSDSGTHYCPQNYVITGMDCNESYCGKPEIMCTEIDTEYSISESKEEKCVIDLTLEECMTAAAVNSDEGWDWDGTRNWDDRTPGCIYDVNNKDINYNTDLNGQGLHNDNRAVCQRNTNFAAYGWPSETGPCHWSDWFSQEEPNNHAPNMNQAIIAVQCRGAYCNDKRVYYCKSLLTDSENIVKSNKFSQEDMAENCPPGRIVTGMHCYGDNCDTIQFDCSEENTNALRPFNDTDRTHKTNWVSEENDGMAQCDEGYVVYGAECHGKLCDDIRLHCRKYQIIEGKSLSYYCDEEGDCHGFSPFRGYWKLISSGGTETFSSSWTKSNSETVSVEEANTYSQSFTVGAAMEYCAGGGTDAASFEMCYSLSFEHTEEMSWSSVFGQEYSNTVEETTEKGCEPNIPEDCASNPNGYALYQWQTQSMTNDGSYTMHRTCIHWAKCEGTISESPNCIPNYCWDNACNNCVAAGDVQTIIDPSKGEMKETDYVDNYIGCHEDVDLTDSAVSYIGLKAKDWDSISSCDLACSHKQYWFLIGREDSNSDEIHCYCAQEPLGVSTTAGCDYNFLKNPNGHLSYFWDNNLYAFYRTTDYRRSSHESQVHRRRL
jgi:hypothetical protein